MADIKLFDTEEKKPNVVERAALKEAINKERPGTMKYEGSEKIYSPKVRNIGLLAGDAAAGVLLGSQVTKGVVNHGKNKVNKYLAEGRSPETKAMADKIVESNKELMSQNPTVDRQTRLIDNTVTESRLPKDNVSDLERTIKNNPKLSNSEMERIKNDTLRKWDADQKPLNNLEATRPGNDVWAHSLNTASDFGILLGEAFPEMSSQEIAKRIEAAKLHDYGKGMVRLGDVISSANFREQPEVNAAKKAEVDAHSNRGARALESLGEDLAAKYAKEHHLKPEDLETQLLKAADVFNALTMERVYRGPMSVEKALGIMKEEVARGVITPKAYAIVEKAVKEGKLRVPQKFDADLEGVYATEAANAVKEKGIRLFDIGVQEPKFIKGLDAFNSIVSSIVAGKGLRTASDLAMDRVSQKAKRNALMALYKDDRVMYNEIKYGIYPDKVIDQMFKDNVDRIIEGQKK